VKAISKRYFNLLLPSNSTCPQSQDQRRREESYRRKGRIESKLIDQKFAFNKPLPSQNIIFFCRSGKRSATASEQAGKNGYGNVRNYVGSWLDWTKREKQADNDD
jgi:3-mercaptopyruvate sulfurtransferase SseA